MKKYFKNKNFVKRDYDCINIVYCSAESAPDDNWTEIENNKFMEGIIKLKTEMSNKGIIEYYGFL